ncbi:transporter [Pontibacter sp. CAU 1760]
MTRYNSFAISWSILLLLTALLLPFSACWAQQDDAVAVKPISTNRPNFSQGSDVVPQGSVQVEAGISYYKDTPANEEIKAHTYPDVLVRVGLLQWLELQVAASVQDSVVREGAVRRKVNGLGPLAVGLVTHLLDEQRYTPELAFKGALTLPVGNRALIPDNPEPSFTVAASKQIIPQTSLLLNAGYRWEGGDPVREVILALSTSVSDALSVYAEAVNDKPKGQQAANFADVGVLWLLKPNLQLDVAVGKQLNDIATDFFITTGISFRLPR